MEILLIILILYNSIANCKLVVSEDTEREENMEINYTKRVPKAIKERTIENMEVYNMSLGDSFEEAVRELAKKGTELWNAWYYSDYRKFLPQIYHEEYLDFNKYPLKY